MKLSTIIFISFFIFMIFCFVTLNNIYLDHCLKIEERELFENLNTADHNYRVIVSLTTSPSRINTIEKTLNTILNQSYPPDLIRINIPKTFKRTGETYTIPSFIKDNSKIKIYEYDEDYGPIMKFLPACIDYKDDDNTIIIYTDDDVGMMDNIIETYVKFILLQPENVYTIGGFLYKNYKWSRKIPQDKILSEIDIPEGYMSVAFKSSIFNKKNKMPLIDYYNIIKNNKDCFQSDDLTIGNFIAMYGIKIKRINTSSVNYNKWWRSGCGYRSCEFGIGNKGDGLKTINTGGHEGAYERAYKFLIQNNLNYI